MTSNGDDAMSSNKDVAKSASHAELEAWIPVPDQAVLTLNNYNGLAYLSVPNSGLICALSICLDLKSEMRASRQALRLGPALSLSEIL